VKITQEEREGENEKITQEDREGNMRKERQISEKKGGDDERGEFNKNVPVLRKGAMDWLFKGHCAEGIYDNVKKGGLVRPRISRCIFVAPLLLCK